MAVSWVSSIALRSRTPSTQLAKKCASRRAAKTRPGGAGTVIWPVFSCVGETCYALPKEGLEAIARDRPDTTSAQPGGDRQVGAVRQRSAVGGDCRTVRAG